ncbi:MAG: hypothetical protein CVV17_00885, partial [Gammaproteobacteria bacterium HGW-Gammaproteobacteria-7]
MATEITNGLEDLRQTFQRHLPRRVEAVARRIEQFHAEGWDINGLSLLHSDAQRLAGASGRHGLIDASELLLALESLLESALTADRLPDSQAGAKIIDVVSRLREMLPLTDSGGLDDASPRAIAADGSDGTVRDPGNRDPAWPQATPDAARAQPESAIAVGSAPAGDRAKESGGVATKSPEAFARRVYHLSTGDELSQQIDQRLAAIGCEVEVLDKADELREVLSALPPDLVVVGAGFSDQLESIGHALLPARQRTGTALPLVVIASDDSMESR